jgi:glycosyltransferase involved in cell wall biosynthesis
MKKLLIVTPHLSTGGAPQVTANKVELLLKEFDIMVVEHAFVAWKFVVQRKRIINLVGESKFKSLGDNKTQEFKDIVESFKPDVISMEEFPEMFMGGELSDWVYRFDRPYTIVETTHDSSFNPTNKRFMPDKFVFVSPYNAIKYLHLKIPYEVIEYPVDKKPQDKATIRKKLGLEHDYKHVVIVGLFTPRKNQKYAFELCAQLHEYKIKFHFLGNQAENFENYWKPLMEWKQEDERLNNCVVWGERDDIDDFMKGADLFLFPSKGDRGNKELNPIVIKEALQYNTLPKLMYNLDVYLNRYHKEEGMNYLSGDINKDAEAILNLTNPKKENNKEEVIIIGTYPNLDSRVQLTKDTINSLKVLGRKIILISHYPVDDEIQRMVDFYLFDAYNPLTHHSYYTRFYRHTNDFHVDIQINGLKHSNQSLTVLINLFTATKFAKSQGFKRFFYSTYDVIINELDVPTIEESFESVSNSNTAYLGTLNTPFGKGIQTNGMTFDVEYFLNNFDDVRNADDYNRVCQNIGAQNFLEDYLVKKINPKANEVALINNQEETFLKHSGLGVASNSEYYSIVPIDKQPNHYMFYFFTYNVDGRKVLVRMSEDNSEFFNGGFQISKSREFKKDFVYSGKPIEIILEFYDGERIYKSEKYSLNSKNLSTYNNTGYFKWVNRKPKVKLVHIQTTLNDEREQRSRESLQRVTKHGIEYILHTNEPYKDLPPKFNCQRPQCVSMELFDESTVHKLGTALTPPHYGCYEAFKNAILGEFYDCDFLIVCEGDCIIEVPIEDFVHKVFEACRICDDNNIGYFSFGDTRTLEHGWLQSPKIEDIGNQDLCFITNHIIGLQCIMFPKFTSAWLKDKLRTTKWDASDMFFNQIFKPSEYKMGIVHKRLTSQVNGYSLIDKQDKSFL